MFKSYSNSQKNCVFIILIFCFIYTNAQEKLTINGVQNTPGRLSGSVSIAGKLKEYYLFYKPDQQDKHSNNYTAQIFDENLHPIKTIDFTIVKDEELLEVLFNGSRFICLFLNEKSKTVITSVYDQEGKEIASYPKQMDKNSMYYFNDDLATIVTTSGQNRYLHAINEKDYFTIIPLKHGNIFSYDVNIYLNNEIQQRTYQSDGEVKYEKAAYLGTADGVLLFSILSKKVLVNNNYESWLLGININDATKRFMITTVLDEYQYLPASISALNNKVLVQGPYFKITDKIQKAKSVGMCALQMNRDGVIKSVKFNDWDKDFARYIVLVDTGGAYDLGHLYFHKFLPMADGNTYAIAEGYKKTDNSDAVFFNALSVFGATMLFGSLGGVVAPKLTTSNITITDLVLVKFDSTFTVKDATIYSKNEHGAISYDEFASTHLEAIKAKQTGSFDYFFTQTSTDNSQFFASYRTMENMKECKCIVLKGIDYDHGKIVGRSLNIPVVANYMWFLPSKPGSMVVVEYFEKEKRLDLHFETMK